MRDGQARLKLPPGLPWRPQPKPPAKRGAGSAAAVLRATSSFAFGDFDTSTALASAVGAGVQGVTGVGVTVIAAFWMASIPAAAQDLVRAISGNTGYLIRATATQFQVFAGNGAASVNTARALGAGDVNEFHVLGLSSDPAGNLVLFFDNASASTIASGGYTSPAVAQRMAVGSQASGGNPASSFSVLGVAGRDSPLVLADFQTICAATKSAGVLSLGGITMAHQWNAVQSPTVPSTYTDAIGSDALTFVVGSQANLVSQRFPRTWGF